LPPRPPPGAGQAVWIRSPFDRQKVNPSAPGFRGCRTAATSGTPPARVHRGHRRRLLATRASLTVQALIDEMPALLIKASRIEKTCDSHSDRALPTPAIIVAANAGILLSPRIRLRENAVVGSSATSTSAGVD